MELTFGGDWTRKKLEALKAYLEAYETIFTKKNAAASHFTRIYVDGFAGTGSVLLSSDRADEEEGRMFLQGSAAVALSLPVGFDHYIFIEKNKSNASELSKIRKQFPERSGKVSIVVEDANTYVKRWCQMTDWKKCRALVFLDPYGMQLDWSTIEAIAQTKAIDLWLLFPLGQGVMRMLTNAGMPPDEWSDKLTRFFGSDAWRTEFYAENPQVSLFDNDTGHIKTATFESIERYFIKRLEEIFEKVAAPMTLKNSTGSPLFLLCFAASNPKGAPIAVRIANYILGEKKNGRIV